MNNNSLNASVFQEDYTQPDGIVVFAIWLKNKSEKED